MNGTALSALMVAVAGAHCGAPAMTSASAPPIAAAREAHGPSKHPAR